jgi:anti-sigma28 factor (negative regulator of flagellin synthesis)
MQAIKKTLLVGAGVLAVGAGSLGVASAATTNTASTGDNTLVQKIADKFGLKQSDVQAVFDQDRASHFADMQAKRTAALKQAVTDGKLTQAQADYITKAWADIDAQRPSDGSKPTDAQRTAMKTKVEALRDWLKQQNLDLRSIAGMGEHGMHPGGFGGPRDGRTDGASSDSGSSSSSTSAS